MKNLVVLSAFGALFVGCASKEFGSREPASTRGRADCGTEPGLSLDERIAKCAETPRKLDDTGQTFSLVARLDGKRYLRDDQSKLVWGPAAEEKFEWNEAKKHCAELTTLGLGWHLPTKTEFLEAGNAGNAAKSVFESFNKQLTYAINVVGQNLWSSTDAEYYDAWFFDGETGGLKGAPARMKGTVRCVSGGAAQ